MLFRFADEVIVKKKLSSCIFVIYTMEIKEHEMRMAFEAWNYHFINQLNLNNNPVAYPYKLKSF
jgi:hypothetical protein